MDSMYSHGLRGVMGYMGPFAMINVTCALSGDLLLCSKEDWSAELEPSSDHPGWICYFPPVSKSPKEQGSHDFQGDPELCLWITHTLC